MSRYHSPQDEARMIARLLTYEAARERAAASGDDSSGAVPCPAPSLRPGRYPRPDHPLGDHVMEHVSIEARYSTDAAWQHVKSVPAWVLDDREALKIQRAHVREICREDWGQDSPVFVRVVDADLKVVA